MLLPCEDVWGKYIDPHLTNVGLFNVLVSCEILSNRIINSKSVSDHYRSNICLNLDSFGKCFAWLQRQWLVERTHTLTIQGVHYFTLPAYMPSLRNLIILDCNHIHISALPQSVLKIAKSIDVHVLPNSISKVQTLQIEQCMDVVWRNLQVVHSLRIKGLILSCLQQQRNIGDIASSAKYITLDNIQRCLFYGFENLCCVERLRIVRLNFRDLQPIPSQNLSHVVIVGCLIKNLNAFANTKFEVIIRRCPFIKQEMKYSCVYAKKVVITDK